MNQWRLRQLCSGSAVAAATVVGALLLGGCGGSAAADSGNVPSDLPQSQAEVDATRSELRDAIWGSTTLPIPEVSAVDFPVPSLLLEPQTKALAGSSQVVTVPLRFDLTSQVITLSPKGPVTCTAIFNSGHGPNIGDIAATVQTLLRQGCVVAIVQMPQSGINGGQVAVLPDGTRTALSSNGLHNDFLSLETANRSALDIFVTPIVATVSYLMNRYRTDTVGAIGFSGGGWLTSIAAAADPRIGVSMSVAGFKSVPQLDTCDGDYEQCTPLLFGRVSAPQIYVLASTGEDRSHTQIFNEFDSCCYSGGDLPDYVDPVKAAVEAVGSGAYYAIVDSTLERHGVPDIAPNRFARAMS